MQHIFPKDAAGRTFTPLNSVQPTMVKVAPDAFLVSFYGWYDKTAAVYQAVFLWPWGSTQAMEEIPLGLGSTDRGSLLAGDGAVMLSFFQAQRAYTVVIPGFVPWRPGHTHEARVTLG